MIPDNDLVNKIKETGDESALLELVDRHSGIYYKTVAKNVPIFKIDDLKDDFYRRKEAEIFNAAKTFDETKGVKFSSWLANQTRYTCLTRRSIEKALPNTVEFKAEYGGVTEENPETEYEKKEMVDQIQSFVDSSCNERCAEIFKLKWFGKDGRGMNFREISEQLQISEQAVCQNLSNTMTKVKKKFNSDLYDY